MSSPRDLSRYQIAVRRHDEGRGGSLFMHQQVQVGTRLEVAHPVNLFPLAKLARKHILIAGGVGITPMMAMIDDLRSGPVPWELHYGVRGPEHDYFGRTLRERDGERVHLYYGSAGQALDFGRILASQPLGTHVYTCGPGGNDRGRREGGARPPAGPTATSTPSSSPRRRSASPSTSTWRAPT